MRHVILVFDDNHDLVDVALREAMGSIAMQSDHAAYQKQFISYCFHGSGDIVIQSGMARLVYGCIVYSTPHEEVGGIDMSDVEDRVYRDLDYVQSV